MAISDNPAVSGNLTPEQRLKATLTMVFFMLDNCETMDDVAETKRTLAKMIAEIPSGGEGYTP